MRKKLIWWLIGAIAAVLISLLLINSYRTGVAAKEIHTISGVVVDISFIAETPLLDDAIIRTIVQFDDGRVAIFKNFDNQVLQKGRINEISFSNKYGISSVKIK